MTLRRIVEGRSIPPHWAMAAGLALNGLVGFIDYLTGYDLGLSVFYVLPVALVTWYASRTAGVATAIVSAGIWLTADMASGDTYSRPLITTWNTVIRIAFLLIIAYLLAALRASMQRTQESSRTDGLTGAASSRHFYDLLDKELDRLSRYARPLTVAYMDLDGFKAVNDTFGHLVGDKVLRLVAECAITRLRKTDVVARLGGDEFVLLCPETDEEAAQTAISELVDRLLEEMRHGGWPVTFSIGVLTCYAAPGTSEGVVKLADDLMYSVKLGTKNNVSFATFGGELDEAGLRANESSAGVDRTPSATAAGFAKSRV